MVQLQRICLPVVELQGTWVQSQHLEDALEKAMATHSSIFAWRITWTEEPGGLQSMGSQKNQTRLSEHTCLHLCKMYLSNIFFFLSQVLIIQS